MRKLLCVIAALCFLLCGCGKTADNSILDEPSVSQNDTPSVEEPSSSKKPESGKDTPSSSTLSAPSSSSCVSSKPDDTRPQAGRTYYYYENLNASQKKVYDAIDSAVLKMESGMLSLGKTSVRDISLAFAAVRADHPEYFWMPHSYINKIAGDQYYIAIEYEGEGNSVSYLCTKAERTSMEAALKRTVAEIKKLIPANASDYEIELFLHDYICQNVSYVDTGANDMRYTAYGALVEKQAICEGYARAMQLLLNEFSIPSTLVCGYSLERGESHMWNSVKIGGDWYNLDVTWDDDDQNRLTTHRYFNLTDSELSKTHIADPDFSTLADGDFGGGTVPSYNFSLPKCTATKYHYPNKAGCILTENTADSQSVVCAVMKAAADKKAAYCEFYLAKTPQNGTSAVALAEKYALQNCKNVVNSKSKHKIAGLSVALSGNTFIVFLNYGG